MSWTNETSQTSDTQYYVGNYNTNLSLITDALLNSVTTNPIFSTPNTFSLPPTSTSGNGVGTVLSLTLETTPGQFSSITVISSGNGYAVGDTLTFTNFDLSPHFGAGTDNLVITLQSNDFGTTENISSIRVPNNTTVDSGATNVAGYSTGTICFSVTSHDGSSLKTGLDDLLSSINPVTLSNAVGPFPRTYNNIIPTGGTGTGAVLSITVSTSAIVSHIIVTSPGTGYAVGNILTVPNDILGTGSTGPTITLDAGDLVPSWTTNSTLEMSIIGRIDINNFIIQTLILLEQAENIMPSYIVHWSIPLETVALRVNNNTAISTGQTITVSNINIITGSNGGSIGYIGTSGAIIGPGGVTPEIQFNDGGSFGGASGALYNKTTGRIQLANGSVAAPMLAFSDDTHPGGTYNTGIYGISPNDLGFSGQGVPKVGLYNTPTDPYIKGLNIDSGGGIKRFSGTVGNEWEDGHLGNFSELVFTPADFITTLGGGLLEPVGVFSAQEDPGAAGSLWYGAITSNNQPIIAQKIIPKGFQITGGEDTIRINTPDSSLTSTTCYVSAQAYDIDPTASLINLLSANTSFDTNTTTTLSGGDTAVGDGKTMVTVYWVPLVQLTIAAGNSPCAMFITMSRSI